MSVTSFVTGLPTVKSLTMLGVVAFLVGRFEASVVAPRFCESSVTDEAPDVRLRVDTMGLAWLRKWAEWRRIWIGIFMEGLKDPCVL